jgi:hypothetical protein
MMRGREDQTPRDSLLGQIKAKVQEARREVAAVRSEEEQRRKQDRSLSDEYIEQVEAEASTTRASSQLVHAERMEALDKLKSELETASASGDSAKMLELVDRISRLEDDDS